MGSMHRLPDAVLILTRLSAVARLSVQHAKQLEGDFAGVTSLPGLSSKMKFALLGTSTSEANRSGSRTCTLNVFFCLFFLSPRATQSISSMSKSLRQARASVLACCIGRFARCLVAYPSGPWQLRNAQFRLKLALLCLVLLPRCKQSSRLPKL